MHLMGAGLNLAVGLLAMLAGTSQAGTYYVATDGTVAGDGSAEHPWPSVDYALEKVGGGNTILVKPGVYSGVLICKAHAGTAEHPTVIKSEKKWEAVLTGERNRGFDNDTGADWITVDGFEVVGARIDGIKMVGNHGVVRNCWVHNSAAQGILGGTVIEDNLVEFNGSNIQFHHGIYTSGNELVVRRNIVRHNANFGLHLYSKLSNSLVAGNVCYGNRGPGIIAACPEGGGKNRILGNTVADNGGGIVIWSGKGEIVVNNLVVAPGDPLALGEGTTDVEAHHNLLLTASRTAELEGGADDPGFINPRRSDYWLKANSPAIGKGDPKHGLGTDFWGRPLPRDRAPDLGAFAFDAFLTTSEARPVRTWGEHGWPYRYTNAPPDFWIFPSKAR